MQNSDFRFIARKCSHLYTVCVITGWRD